MGPDVDKCTYAHKRALVSLSCGLADDEVPQPLRARQRGLALLGVPGRVGVVVRHLAHGE